MDLETVHPEPRCALRGGDERVAHAREACPIERARRRLALLLGHGGRRIWQPATLVDRDQLAALPGHAAGRLAARVRDLHRHLDLGMPPNRRQHGHQRRLRGVVPQAQAVWCDPAGRLDRRGLDAQHAGARERQVTEVDQVPGSGGAVLRRVLAHGRDNDPVGKRDAAQGDGREQRAHDGIRQKGGYEGTWRAYVGLMPGRGSCPDRRTGTAPPLPAAASAGRRACRSRPRRRDRHARHRAGPEPGSSSAPASGWRW